MTYWISAQSECFPGRDGRHLESFSEIWMNVVLAKVVAWSYIYAYVFANINIPYEMFLTIQLHLTCRKDRIHNHLQAKKNEDLFRRTSDNSFKTKNNMMNAVTSLMLNLPVQEEWCQGTVSRPEEKFIVPSCSRWKHRGIQSNICSTRLLMKRRQRLWRDICS